MFSKYAVTYLPVKSVCTHTVNISAYWGVHANICTFSVNESTIPQQQRRFCNCFLSLSFPFCLYLCVCMCMCSYEKRIPEFKSFEELELPKHSKVKRQMSTPNASELEQQPEISVEEWQDKPTHEIIQKFHVS